MSRILILAITVSILFFATLLQFGCYRLVEWVAFFQKSPQVEFPPVTFEAQPNPTEVGLDPLTERSLSRFGSIIKKYSGKYELDWRLVLAVMRQESRFKPTAVSQKGAYGLMQIMPVTETEIIGKLGLEEGKSPYNNIKVGTYYLRSLYRLFSQAPEGDRIRLTLAAYNAGIGRILDARAIAEYFGDNPNSWHAVRYALPLLSKRYYTLHRHIWEEGRPGSGYFGNDAVASVLDYVENVMQYYDEYRRTLN